MSYHKRPRPENNTGIPGVQYEERGGGQRFAVHLRKNNNRVRRFFSIKLYGNNGAYNLAVQLRKNWEDAVDKGREKEFWEVNS